MDKQSISPTKRLHTYTHTAQVNSVSTRREGEVFVFLIDEIQSIYPVLYKSHSLQSCRYLCLANHIVVVLKNVILFLMLASAMMMHANKHLNR